jgi:hypothetical protein
MTLKSASLVCAAAALSLSASVALAQTAAQHNGPGGPREKVEKLVGQLPPPPPTPTPSVSTTTVTSPPAAPPKKN